MNTYPEWFDTYIIPGIGRRHHDYDFCSHVLEWLWYKRNH